MRAAPAPRRETSPHINRHRPPRPLPEATPLRGGAQRSGSLLPFDPDLYEARIPNDEVPDDLLLDALAALRSVNISLLRALPDEAWKQTVQHPEVGPQTLERIVGIFGNHVTNHLNDMKNAGLGVRAL